MKDKLRDSFAKKIDKLNIPYYCAGRILDKNGKTKFFEVVIMRPYRYMHKEILKTIPKTFKGFKVKVV